MASRDEDEASGPMVRSSQGQGPTRDEVTDETQTHTAIANSRATNETISQDRTENQAHVFTIARREQQMNDQRRVIDVTSLVQRHTEGSTQYSSSKLDLDCDSHFSNLYDQERMRDNDGDSSSSDVPDKAERPPAPAVDGLLGDQIPSGQSEDQVIRNLLSSLSILHVENQALKQELARLRGSVPVSSSGQVEGTEEGEREEEPDEGSETEREAKEEADDTADVSSVIPTFYLVVQHVRAGVIPSADDSYFYKDPPRLFKGDRETDHLRGTQPSDEDTVYLEQHPEVGFGVVWKYHSDRAVASQILRTSGYRNGALACDSAPVKPHTKYVSLGPAVKSAIVSILESYPERFPGFTPVLSPKIEEPYLLFYLHNKTLMELKETSNLGDIPKLQLEILCQWMEDNCRADWDEADELLAKGKINEKHFAKLYRPKELVVRSYSSNDVPMEGYQISDYHELQPADITMVGWKFNGSFHKSRNRINISLAKHLLARNNSPPPLDENQAINVTDLVFCPARFLEGNVKSKLVARGLKLWECRKKKLVCYHEPDSEFEVQAQRRYMVDYKMYKRLHPTNDIFMTATDPRNQDLIEREDPPEDDFLACLPPTVAAFDFSRKAWRILNVDRISDVTWNKTAFAQLVAPDETKELIQAVVTAHGQRSSIAPDIIEGKGQGLLILLHGGPGTGKTLTAESIAEEQERPLYRVTCGDIGTEPRDVERYLGDVLEIGKAWGCVVLLDEADVFLEERSLADQKRNAIISIFLRILEYYDGILILTTNRVGSFDEAFKSRIQLALGYPRLDEEDRLKIWRNFIKMLGKTKERIDMDDLDMNLPQLARVEVNGRQIRNIITMARHLAKFRGQMLRYKHMQDAVRSVQKFNEYLDQVKGIPDDDWARADKLR